MIQNYSYMDVADNSGAKQAMCFHVFGGTRRRYASLGDIVVVAVKEAIPHASVKKGDVVCVLESMKMQVSIKSHKDGTVKKIKVKPAASVAKNDVLAEIE